VVVAVVVEEEDDDGAAATATAYLEAAAFVRALICTFASCPPNQQQRPLMPWPGADAAPPSQPYTPLTGNGNAAPLQHTLYSNAPEVYVRSPNTIDNHLNTERIDSRFISSRSTFATEGREG